MKEQSEVTRRIRPRSSHLHNSCGHWCFRYGCADGAEDCGECRTRAFNAKGGGPISGSLKRA